MFHKTRWDYAQEVNVQLPDEYDTIWRELEPLWGIDPEDLIKIQELQENKTDTFTIAKTETYDSDLVKTAFSDPDTWQQRALLRGLEEILALLEPVEDALPPYRAVFSPHDNPNLLSDYHVKKVTLDAAAAGTCTTLCFLPIYRELITIPDYQMLI